MCVGWKVCVCVCVCGGREGFRSESSECQAANSRDESPATLKRDQAKWDRAKWDRAKWDRDESPATLKRALRRERRGAAAHLGGLVRALLRRRRPCGGGGLRSGRRARLRRRGGLKQSRAGSGVVQRGAVTVGWAGQRAGGRAGGEGEG